MNSTCLAKFKTIVIDPPWKVQNGFTNEKFVRYGRALPYKTMTDKEIEKFPINNFADSECDLFIWTTQTKLPAALKIMQKWGFKYHACLNLDKLGGVAMMGFYRRTEMVLYGYRGKFGVRIDEGNYIPTLFTSKATGHSKKPDLFYKIVRERTQEPRIDIFARKRHFGFESWGNQLDNFFELPLEVLVK